MKALSIVLACMSSAIVIGVYAPQIGRRLHIFDAPDSSRKVHSTATPLVGGFMIVLSICMYSWIEGFASPTPLNPDIGIIAFCCIAAFLIGMSDDISDLSAVFRLISLGAAIAVASVWNDFVVVRLLHSGLFGFEQGLAFFALPLTVLAIIGLTNALNMTDGINGLFGGLIVIYLIALCIVDSRIGTGYFELLLGTMASTLVFLVYNLRGKLFMGDSGAYCASVMVALISIHIYNVADGQIPGELLGLWFAVPVLDMARVSIIRIRAGRSAFSADRQHFHHFLHARYNTAASLAIFLLIMGVPIITATISYDLIVPALGCQLVAYASVLFGLRNAPTARGEKV